MVCGTVLAVAATLEVEKLKVTANVQIDSGPVESAVLPDREVSAILPRSILLGDARLAPVELVDTIAPIVERMTVGRRVRLWEYRDARYCAFLSWRPVRFKQQE